MFQNKTLTQLPEFCLSFLNYLQEDREIIDQLGSIYVIENGFNQKKLFEHTYLILINDF